MEIADAKVIVCSPGRNFVTLKVTADEGVTGVGDATLNGRELAVASYLTEHVVPLLIGRDPRNIEDIWHFLYKGAYWRRGPVTMTSIGAVDIALWDIKGKLLDTHARVRPPRGAGARRRDRLRACQRLGRRVHRGGRCPHVEMGYKAVRVQSGVPGLAATYGVGRGDLYDEPADRDTDVESWSTEAYLHFIPTLFARARKELGYGVSVLHDVHHRLRPIEAAQLGRRIEEYQPFWLEDAVPAELQEGFRLIRGHTTTPLAVGEVFNTIYDAHLLITEQLIDYIRMTVAHAGGLTHLVRIAHLAELYHVRTGCHGPTDLSPVNLAAAVHFGIAVHNFGVQEYMRHNDDTDRVFPHTYSFANGYLQPGEGSGLGVDIDEELASELPYEPAYLPVNRLTDGTVHSW